MKKTVPPRKYLEVIKRSRYHPNFWCSEEYFQAASWTVLEEGGRLDVRDSDGAEVLPSLLLPNGKFKPHFPPYWAGLIRMEGGVFLDWNYLYRPSNFNHMEGGDWATFRKNSRKWPRANPRHEWRTQKDPQDSLLLEDWINDKSVVSDPEVLLYYWFNSQNSISLYCEEKLVAWLAWDENYYAVNFRWLVTSPSERYLEEYCRWFFYVQVASGVRRVNDGGTLDNPGLERFKNKLQPIERVPIYGKGV